ncbi:MAG TPA: discoidin domain-containing protein [Phycisphaerales bacterium]|nr:discoidin domain-containing protein [Phycisphaerales bacterium]
MKKLVWLSVVLTIGLIAFGCKKSPTPPAQPDDEQTTRSVESEPATSTEQVPATSETEPANEDENLVPIPLTLPKPMFVGTPQNLEGVQNLEKPLGRPRPPFLAPEGVANVALNKPVTSSEPFPIMGDLEMIVDGDKEATEGSVVELGPFAQWVMIDLEKEHDIYAIVVWHYHRTPAVYFNVVVEISNDPEFIESTVVFNNDHNNSLGLGVGTDQNYVETSEGKLIDCKGIRGRYVRLWSEGNNQNDYNHYIEVEVYGK